MVPSPCQHDNDDDNSKKKSMLRNPDLFLRQHQLECASYAAILLGCGFIYHFFSSGDMSFLMTLSSVVNLAAFALVGIYIKLKSSCAGISRKMLDCYALIMVGRMISVVPFEGYIPYDTTGDHIYQILEVMLFSVIAWTVWLCKVKFPETASALDTFQISYIIVPSVILGVIMHPNLNPYQITDIFWAIAHYLEVLACLPQLFMFQRERKVYPWTAHFLAALAVAKFIDFIFWIEVYEQVAVEDHSIRQYAGYVVLGLSGGQLLLMGDFLKAYFTCVASGKGIETMSFGEEDLV